VPILEGQNVVPLASLGKLIFSANPAGSIRPPFDATSKARSLHLLAANGATDAQIREAAGRST
jgi:hypothetical protein